MRKLFVGARPHNTIHAAHYKAPCNLVVVQQSPLDRFLARFEVPIVDVDFELHKVAATVERGHRSCLTLISRCIGIAGMDSARLRASS
jgi:hypothetical protein